VYLTHLQSCTQQENLLAKCWNWRRIEKKTHQLRPGTRSKSGKFSFSFCVRYYCGLQLLYNRYVQVWIAVKAWKRSQAAGRFFTNLPRS